MGLPDDKEKMLLGKHAPVVEEYAPQLLYPIARAAGRKALGTIGPMHGADLWHAYELSWLNSSGKPVVRVGRFHIPVDSPNMIESKSFKLYLNSLNSHRFDSEEQAVKTILGDVSAAVGQQVTLELLMVDDQALAGTALAGNCLDDLPLTLVHEQQPDAELLGEQGLQIVEERLYSHLLRSLCPVTGQPDWATVWLHYRGGALDGNALLRYIVAFRRHQDFHEQCVERMFRDFTARFELEFLHIQAFYTRRGGMDINPFRSTDPEAGPLPRLNRQ